MAGAHALVIASDRYDDPALQQLRGPARDAEELVRTLADPAVGGYDVTALVNQPAHLVAEEVEGFFGDRRRDDLLLLYFSCHGIKDDAGRLYFATTNTKLRRLAATGISDSFVKERMERSRSNKVVLLLDCCYSGAFAKGLLARAGGSVDLPERFAGDGHVFITASKSLEYAYEVGAETEVSGSGSPSLFTSAVVEGLRTGAADLDEDGLVSFDELYEYVYEQVRSRTTSQTPLKGGHVEGALYLARNPRNGPRGQEGTTPRGLPDQRARQDAPDQGAVERRYPTSKQTTAVAAAVALAGAAVAVVLWGPTPEPPDGTTGSPQPTTSPQPTGSPPPTGSPSPTADPPGPATPGQVLSQGTVTLPDPWQGLDLASGELVIVLQSSLAAGPLPDQLSVFDETTSGARLLGEVPFDDLGPAELASLEYRRGVDNPPLPRAQVPPGSVVAVHVRDGVHAKVRVEDWSADGLRLRWVTYATG